MDIQNLITFMYVAEMNSFTKAAAFLGYSQSTVSFQIKQIENEFDCQLFERINHRIALTPKGEQLLEYAHRIKTLNDEIKENMTDKHIVSGNVCLASADSLCRVLLRDKFISFRNDYPNINLQLITAGTQDMFRMLDCNEADAIVTLDSHIYNTDYVVAAEEKVSVFFVASPDIISKTHNLSIKDIIHYPFILTEKNMSYRRILDEKLAEMSLEIKPVLEMCNTEIIADIVEQGAGISLLPDYIVNDKIKDGKLVKLDVSDIEIEVWKQLLYHRKKWVSKQLKTVIEHFCNQ